MKFQLFTTTTVVASTVLMASFASAHRHELNVNGRNGKILTFEDQLTLHRSKKTGKLDKKGEILSVDHFMEKYLNSMDVLQDELKEVDANNLGYEKIVKYNQYIGGIPVFGAQVFVVEGFHGGVVRATSEAIYSGTKENMVTSPSVSLESSIDSIISFIAARYGSQRKSVLEVVHEDVVFYRNTDHGIPTGPLTLVRHIKASTIVDHPVPTGGNKNWGIVFDAFVNAVTGEVVGYHAREEDSVLSGVRKTRVLSSTTRRKLDEGGGVTDFDDFPSSNEIIVYDCEGAASCPSSPPVMWRSTEAGTTYQWPTTDGEINRAVAISVQMVRMMRAISNQQWVSYRRSATQLKIYLHIDMQNAYYNGVGIYFGQAFVSDDVIPHEWGHGYTDYSSNLVYADESGALNECHSDVLGETVDILNSQSTITSIGADDLIGMNSPRQPNQDCYANRWPRQVLDGTDQSRWWLMGEEIGIGPIRDMYYPECFNHPSKMDSEKYYCGSDDNGGVHWNSGVGNRLFALGVQGGIDNGVTIPALGLTKMLNLYWNTNLAIGSTTTFLQFATAMQNQCQDAIGTTFNALDFQTGASTPDTTDVTNPNSLQLGGVMTAQDCDTLDLAIEATKMKYEVDYSTCTLKATVAPTAAPSGPSPAPTTAAPSSYAPVPEFLEPFSTSDTNGGSVNTIDQEFNVCEGQTLTFSVCTENGGSFQGDTFLRLNQGSQVIATNDDLCSLGSSITHTFSGTGCPRYTLHQGCYGAGSCSGRVAVVGATNPSPVANPVTAPTFSTDAPVASPTEAPAATAPVPNPIRAPVPNPTLAPVADPTHAPTPTPQTSFPEVFLENPQCLPYSIVDSDGSGASMVECMFDVCGDTVLSFSTCHEDGKTCQGDTKLSLYGSTGTKLDENDDNCGLCSRIVYPFTGPGCKTYKIEQACYSGECGGTVKIAKWEGPPPLNVNAASSSLRGSVVQAYNSANTDVEKLLKLKNKKKGYW